MKKKIVAVVLCGGMGTRISELTKKIPKSLISVYQKPIIWYVISSLIKNDIKEIIFPLGYKGGQIKRYVLKHFKSKDLKFYFVETGEKTEINDRIKMIKDELEKFENFLLVNSDTIFDFNLKKFIKFHVNNNFLISLSGIKMFANWGSIVKNSDNLVKNFTINSKIIKYNIDKYEKYPSYRNTGISIINSYCLNFISKIKNKNFEHSLYNNFIKKKNVGVQIFDSFWYPIETFKDFILLKHDKLLKKNLKNLKNTYNKK